MKKKIIALAMCVVMVAVAVVGGTLAYFTDTDAQTNVFVVGNVKIDLFEDFNSEKLELIPAVEYLDKESGLVQWRNTIEKEAYVENTGKNDVYVRLHIAVPAFIKDGENINILNTTCDEWSTEDGEWVWSADLDAHYPGMNAPATTPFNMYRNITINGIPYKVYVVTYESVLEPGDVTVDAINKVYMPSNITQEDIATWNETFGKGNWEKIYIVAEAAQADGFSDAITALDTAFGKPGTYSVNFTADAENKEWVDLDDARVTETVLQQTTVGGVLVNADVKIDDAKNTVTYTQTNVDVEWVKNPLGQEAYWLGYLNFTAPEYADAKLAKFTRNGVEKSFWECKDTADDAITHTMQAWVAANEADKEAKITYTFDWDGDGVFEAVYTVKATELNLVKPVTNP